MSGCGCVDGAPQSAGTLVPQGAYGARTDAKSKSLLYISDTGANDVAIYTYPGATFVDTFTGFGAVAGLCSDKIGNVFVVDEAGPVQMFSHGGTTPIRKLVTSGAPYDCSVDPTTGNLAITQLSSYLYGAIAVYRNAKGKPVVYQDKAEIDATWFCGYDPSGNLFADAWDRDGNPILVELPKGGKAFKIFKLGETFDKVGGASVGRQVHRRR